MLGLQYVLTIYMESNFNSHFFCVQMTIITCVDCWPVCLYWMFVVEDCYQHLSEGVTFQKVFSLSVTPIPEWGMGRFVLDNLSKSFDLINNDFPWHQKTSALPKG